MKSRFNFCSLLFLICFLFQNSYSQQNVNGWYWMNGQPQSMSLKWVKYVSATSIYAVGDRGCFMRSTDGGENWLINSQAGPSDVNSTTYGGGTRNLNTAYFIDENTGVVGGFALSSIGDAIGRTTDGGLTFSKIVIGSGSQSVNGFYFLNSSTGYACGNANTRLFKTTDAGLTWVQDPNIPSNTYNAVYAFDENKILVTTGGRMIVKTTDAGATWTTDTLPGSTNNTLTDIDFKDSNTGFVTGNANYFGYTFDGGATWTQSAMPFGASGQRALTISGNDVYSAGQNTVLYKTTNNGLSWSSINFIDGSNSNQPASNIIYGLDVSGSDIAIVGNEGIVNLSNDGGTTWRNKNYSVSQGATRFSAIWSDKPTGNVWAAGTPGTILYSSNGGNNWTQQTSNSLYSVNNIQFLNSTTGFFVSGLPTQGNGRLNKTTNAGTTWFDIPLPSPYFAKAAVDVDFVNQNTGWVLGGMPPQGGGGLTCLKTTNGGATWVQQTNDQGYNFVAVSIDMIDANTGYFLAGMENFVFKTTDGGSNWISSIIPGSGFFNKLKAVSGDIVFVSGDDGQLFKSTNSGTTWNLVNTPLPCTIFAMDWLDENNGLIGGTSGFLAKTTNGGTNWDWTNSGGSTIRNVCMRNRDSVYAVSDINGSWQMFRNFASTPSPQSLFVKVGIQGFWNGSVQVSDTVKVTLRNPNAPFNILASQNKVFLRSDGSGTVSFSGVPNGSFFVQINHRNSLETWSNAAVVFTSGYNSKEFISSASQSYGNNTILTSGRYCNYSGDVTQDGNIDLADVVIVNNSSSVFTTGYVVQDVNGDNIVDLSDLVITSNNASNFVSKITP